MVIVKITISLLVIGLRKVLFSTNLLARLVSDSLLLDSCYWTVCYRRVQQVNHFQRCSLNQPITFKVIITCCVHTLAFVFFACSLIPHSHQLNMFN